MVGLVIPTLPTTFSLFCCSTAVARLFLSFGPCIDGISKTRNVLNPRYQLLLQVHALIYCTRMIPLHCDIEYSVG
ncbi:hypothetical protein M758_6G181300 [Ceratodon purpureus]|uniref:Secreted protein n=1 Tax=Ceratodon purpureus TaxID=3225 RepID=A0A8T0HIC5_CERPU|nr:hypothetical protein KC19_6G188100 [Ceratodon purpureus]KAG0614492.1 hypothetical protein M758_6G181300 [Ceratodon purpureus]